jgi:hypothetical protein
MPELITPRNEGIRYAILYAIIQYNKSFHNKKSSLGSACDCVALGVRVGISLPREVLDLVEDDVGMASLFDPEEFSIPRSVGFVLDVLLAGKGSFNLHVR